MLDLTIASASTLFSVVRNAESVMSDPESQRSIEKLEPDIIQAKSYANELRHAAYLRNHEKY
jgi:hypothetical protein